MNLTTVEYVKRGHIAYVTLNRPDKLNAMNADMHRELGEIWDDFQQDDAMRAAILSGNGRCFSAGADLSGGAPDNYRYTGDFPDISRTRRVFKPIVAALHSHVVGYGMWIAMDADIRVATADTSFWLPEPQWGIATIPAGWFQKMVPWAIASELLLLADRVDAERAREVGIVNKVVTAEDLMAEAEAMARQFADGPTKAFGGTKRLLQSAFTGEMEVQLERESVGISDVVRTSDAQHGISAFLNKEKPTFTGG